MIFIGIYSYYDGAKYNGEWKNDLKEGKGKTLMKLIFKLLKIDKFIFHQLPYLSIFICLAGIFQYTNGENYEGEVKNDKKEGKGKKQNWDHILKTRTIWKN